MRLTPVLLTLFCAAGPALGGAWPRGEASAFLSLKYTGRWDREDIALLDFTREDLFQGYAEWGISSGLTFGGEYSAAGPEIAPVTEIRGFVRYTFLQRGPHVMSVEFGAGQRSNDFEYEVNYIRPGLAWGRGYDSRLGNGWLELDGQAEFYDNEDETALKLDATVGMNVSNRLAVVVQARAGDYPESDPYLRIAPSAVIRLSDWLRVQAEVEGGVYNDTGLSGALALWFDF